MDNTQHTQTAPEGALFAIGERVLIRDGWPESGANATVKTVKIGLESIVYGIHVDETEQTRIIEAPAEALQSLQIPIAKDGRYYTPAFILPGGNEIVFPYPDMMASDEAGAVGVLRRFQNSVGGVMFTLHGAQSLDRNEIVEQTGEYLKSVWKIEDQKIDVVIVGGPLYEKWRAGELADAPPVAADAEKTEIFHHPV